MIYGSIVLTKNLILPNTSFQWYFITIYILLTIFLKTLISSPVILTYSGGRDGEDLGLRLTWEKSKQDLISTTTTKSQGWWFRPVIPATQESIGRKITYQGQPWAKMWDPIQKVITKSKKKIKPLSLQTVYPLKHQQYCFINIKT
jgi:hypothetical protein